MYKISKSRLEKINLGLLLVIAMFPIMPNAVQSLSFMLYIFSLTLCNFDLIYKRIKIRKLWIIYFIITGYLWFSVITIFWSGNLDEALKDLGRQSLLFIFPFVTIFLFKSLKEKTLTLVAYSYLTGLIIYIIIWYFFHVEGVSVFQEIIAKEAPIRDKSFFDKITFILSNSYTDYISGATEEGHKIIDGYKIFSHRVYISSYFVFGFFLANWTAFKSKRLITKIICLIVSFIFLFFILYLSSIQSLLLLLIALIFSIKFIKNKKAIVIILLLGIIIFYKPLSNKFTSIGNFEIVQKVNIDDDQNIIIDYKRFKIYKCIKKNFSANNFIGLGVGDVQDYLDGCLYGEKNSFADPLKEYNSHSQFLHYFMVGGIINLLLFLFCFYYLFKCAYKEKNNMYLYFLLIVFILCMFENYLSRIYGILFYSLFLMLLPKHEPS